MNFYAYTDKALKYLRVFFIREFNRTEMKIRMDELNIISQTKDLYDRLESEVLKVFLRIARHKYKECGGIDTLEMAWLLGLLGKSDPLTGYIFLNDKDRKRQYYSESLMSGGDISKETKKALRYYYSAIRQYADIVTTESAVQAFRDIGVEHVRWRTNLDGRECNECLDMNNNIYPINNISERPHYGCRCWIERVD